MYILSPCYERSGSLTAASGILHAAHESSCRYSRAYLVPLRQPLHVCLVQHVMGTLLSLPPSVVLYQEACRNTMLIVKHSLAECDGPTRVSLYTTATGADTVPGAQELPGAGTNQLSLATVTQGPGRGTAEPREGEKPASQTREVHDREGEESGVDGERTHPRTRQEDEEEAGGSMNLAAAREAERGTPATLLEKRGAIRCVSLPN
ncbi:hypothetical protein NDU88_006391 [Pleurodeles waltl]|uniref:Uncharacterized protein n=1 Tax=Pleurodeles waltl TaxID=8319 RepID=A0AAV7PNB7_PLEWA|nr:hypothetical protein NDU88_006391 [Pleurodeles waltl]